MKSPAPTNPLSEPIRQFFSRTPLLARLCDQNGWPDEDSLEIRSLGREGNESYFEVQFEEILKEGSGCECGRNQCWGRIALQLSADGQVIDARIVAGDR